MKKIGIIICTAILSYSCQNELDIKPQGDFTDELLVDDVTALESFLFSAYAVLDGNLDDFDVWRSAPSNWTYGEVASDNAYKGSDPGDQTPIDNIEAYTPNATSSFFEVKYRALYDGISKANAAILRVNTGLENGLSEEDANQLIGEARFLRGHYHFEAKKMWNKIAYVDENVAEGVPNTTDPSVWDKIEADFQFGVDNMSESSDAGRANSWMAKTYLAKIHMYQGDFAAAKPILDDVINAGPYGLNARYSDNFNAAFDNSIESIFAIQYVVNEGVPNDSTGNWGDILNFPQTSEAGGGCCGFFQPSQNLVNAFRTDASGLPLLDTFNDTDVANEEAQYNAYLAANGDDDTGYDDTFQIETDNLDPRLDRTVGRRGIDYNGFGIHPGRSWIRNMANAGPYLPKKNVHRADQVGIESTSGAAWSGNVNGMNVNIIRFAEVLLWRAEIAAAEGDLGTAVMYVDMVRARAANPSDFIPGANANYVVSEYGNFVDQEQAIKAVEHEQRIELAMEGHRFFELVRKGTAADVLNAYIAGEQDTRTYLAGKSFTAGNEYYPFPQAIIDQSGGVLTPN